MITSHGLEVRPSSIGVGGVQKPMLSQEYILGCIAGELLRMFAGHQGRVQKS